MATSRPTRYVAGGNELLDSAALLHKASIIFGQTVGDLGCGGNGIFTIQAARMVGEKGKVYAVDVLKTALKNVDSQAKIKGLDNIQTIWSNLEIYKATHIPDASLDIGLLINILFQTRKIEEVLREVARLLKPGATLLIVDWKKGHGVPFGPPDEQRIDPRELTTIVTGLGFTKKEMFEPGAYHYGLLFVK